MITLTPEAVVKIKEFIEKLGGVEPTTKKPIIGLRVGVVGGGCSGFQYKLVFLTEDELREDWNLFEFDGLKTYVDPMSILYLEGVEIDYVEQVDGAGFRFKNPNVTKSCGCGNSFS